MEQGGSYQRYPGQDSQSVLSAGDKWLDPDPDKAVYPDQSEGAFQIPLLWAGIEGAGWSRLKLLFLSSPQADDLANFGAGGTEVGRDW